MQLILENSEELESFVEINESSGEKTYVIKGTFSTPDKENRNGRIYSKKLWEDNVKNYQKEIAENTINTLMEKEHPPRTNVDPDKAIARIRVLEMRNGLVYGESEIMNVPETQDIRKRIDEGKHIGVSSRGVGKLNGKIVEEFTLITYDIVKNPSDYAANTTGFNESLILEHVEIEADGHGGWICTPEGCKLVEDTIKDIIEESQCTKKAKALIEAFDTISNAINVEAQKLADIALQEKFNRYITKYKGTINDI